MIDATYREVCLATEAPPRPFRLVRIERGGQPTGVLGLWATLVRRVA